MMPRMSKLTLKLRDLSHGAGSLREFEDEAAVLAFLRDRPRFTDVLGVAGTSLTPEQNARLKAAMRPLDEDERAAERRLAEADERAAEAARALRGKEEAKARAAHRESLKNADPNRPMTVRYHYDGGIDVVDPDDPREITAEAREAVLAWVAERTTWVEPRGQMVGEAKLTVWPGPLPKPGADRVQSGSFTPVTAPPKESAR
jgi:hypothetical protein